MEFCYVDCEVGMKEEERATPEMIAAAWATWKKRHGGKLGPGPAFVEAINAALKADNRKKGGDAS